MSGILKRIITILLSTALIINASPTGVAIASSSEEIPPSEYIPGDLIVGIKDGMRLSREELNNHATIFPGVDIVRIRDLTDLSDIIPDPKPYKGPQILLLVLANDSKEYMLEAKGILEKNPIVTDVSFNYKYYLFEPYEPNFEGDHMPGELLVGIKEGMRLSREELNNHANIFPGVEIVRI